MENIMKRAHEIKNAAAAKFNCKPSEIIFSICLAMAWEEKDMETKTVKVEERKPYYQIGTFYTSTCYADMNTCNQIIMSNLFEGNSSGPMDNEITLRRFANGTSKEICSYER